MELLHRNSHFTFTLLVSLSVGIISFSQVNADENGTKGKSTIAQEAARPQSRPDVTSGLGVPAGETFHLGERPTGDFVVSAYNIGSVPVTILASRGKRREIVGEVKPGETVIRKFRSSDGVLVQNQAMRKAQLTVEAWGTKDLSMYYKPNSEEPAVNEAVE